MLDRRGHAPPVSRSWAVVIARLGFAACGIMYVGIGLTAAAVAMGLARQPRDASGVLRVIARQPLGEIMLAVLAAGLVGYAAMSIVGAVQDPDEHGRSATGLLIRASDVLAGALYMTLAASAVRLIAQPRRGGFEIAALADRLLSLPLGAAALALVGLAIVGAGGFLLDKAFRKPFGARLDRRELTRRARRWIIAAARVGTAARGVIFVVCGGAAIRAALERSPKRVAGVGDALTALGNAAIGPWLLAAMAVGFTGYGIYQLAKARYRRLRFD